MIHAAHCWNARVYALSTVSIHVLYCTRTVHVNVHEHLHVCIVHVQLVTKVFRPARVYAQYARGPIDGALQILLVA